MIIFLYIIFLVTVVGALEILWLTLMSWLPARKSDVQNHKVGSHSKRLALIMPAHNEELGIANTIKSVLGCEKPLRHSEIIVIADNCSDDTKIVAESSGVRVIERFDAHKKGKGHALEYGFSILLKEGFDAFIVIDADTKVDPSLVEEFRRYFRNGAQACQCCYRVANRTENFRSRLMNIAYLGFCFIRPLGRSRAGISAGIFGNGFGLTKESLATVPYQCYSIVEDLQYHIQLVRANIAVEFIGHVSVWGSMPVKDSAASSQRARWEGGRLRVAIDNIPLLLKDLLRTRRAGILELIAELFLLPLAYHLFLLLLLLALALFVNNIFFVFYALFALFSIAFHVVTAMIKGKADAEDWKALLMTPWYICWKFLNIGGILSSSRRKAKWKRTER